jgi:protein dithiol oxidoreductase (disulfide-forming)
MMQLKQMLNMTLGLILFCLTSIASASVDPATVFKEGVHYKAFDIPASTTPKAVEFFSVLCPHCYQFESVVHFLEKEITGLQIAKIHVNFMRSAPKKVQDELSKALIIGKMFGFESAFVHAAFEYVHTKNQRFNTPKQVWDFARFFSPAPLDLEKIAKSDSISQEIEKWGELTEKMSEIKAVTGVPTLVINNRFVPISNSVKSNDEYKQLVAYLLSMTAK